jgi:hypothetical protein
MKISILTFLNKLLILSFIIYLTNKNDVFFMVPIIGISIAIILSFCYAIFISWRNK